MSWKNRLIKDQHKFFKDQTNVINNNREEECKAGDSVKVEDDEIPDVGYLYIGDKYKIWLIEFLSMDYWMKIWNYKLTNFENQKLDLTNIIKNYLKENFLNFEKFIKKLANIHDKINMMIDYYKPKTKIKYEDKKRVVSIFNKIKSYMLDLYTYHETIFKVTEKSNSRIKLKH